MESPLARRQRPVLVLPGMGGGDGSTAALRMHLVGAGYRTYRWKAGRNIPTRSSIPTQLTRRLEEIFRRNERPVSIVGWSLGGLYGCRLAQEFPDRVDRVITLGSPLHALGPVPVPLVSIWTRGDTIVNWRSSHVNGPLTENIEVRGGHLTIGFDPAVAYAIVDRLDQPHDDPRAFTAPPLLRAAFPRAGATTADG